MEDTLNHRRRNPIPPSNNVNQHDISIVEVLPNTFNDINEEEDLEPLRSPGRVLMEMLCALYFGGVALMGIAISFSSAINKKGAPTSTTYSHVFLIYVYGIGCVALLTLLILISKYQKKGFKKSTYDSMKPEIIDLSFDVDNNRNTPTTAHAPVVVVPDGVTRCIDQDTHGVSFYMRMGLVIFTTGILILYLLILLEPADALSKKCAAFKLIIPLFVYYFLEVIYVLLQSYILFKHHRIIFRMHTPLVKFLISHLVATNIARWSFGIVQEAFVFFENYGPYIDPNATLHNEFAHIIIITSNKGGGGGHIPPNSFSSILNTTHMTNGTGNGTIPDPPFPPFPELGECLFFVATSINAAEYLGPCIVEYSLVCVSITLKMFWAVTDSVKKDHHTTDNDHGVNGSPNQESGISASNQNIDNIGYSGASLVPTPRISTGDFVAGIKTVTKCHKANWGLFLGLSLSSAYIVYLIISFIYLKFSAQLAIILTVKSVTLFLTSLTIPLLIYAIYQLCFKSIKLNETNAVIILDKVLITFTGVNVLIYDIFAIISSCNALIIKPEVNECMTLAVYVINCIHIVLQTGFLNDALQRRVKDSEAAHRKPARTVLTLLVFLNIIFWMNKSFRAKRDEYDVIHFTYYGHRAWCIITNFFLPLNIFYSFHASVIVAEIWHQAYHLPHAAH